MQYIYIFIQTPLKFECIFSEALCVSSLELHPGGLKYSLALQCHWSTRSIAGSYIRSYEIFKKKIDNVLLSTLSIMSNNRFSPSLLQNLSQCIKGA